MDRQPQITLIVPTARSPHVVIPALFAMINQSLPPVQTIVYDTTMGGWADSFDDVGGWFCTRNNILVHRGRAGELPQVGRKWGINYARTDWIWLVDDDVFPIYNCLEEMWATAERSGAICIGGTKKEVSGVEWPGQFNWWFKVRFDREFDSISPVADTGLMLFHKDAWNLATSDAYNGVGEDLFITAQIGVRTPIMLSAKGRAMHFRGRAPRAEGDKAWDGRESRFNVNVNHQWMLTNLKPLLTGDGEWDRFVDSLNMDRARLQEELDSLSTEDDVYSFMSRFAEKHGENLGEI